MIKKFFLIKFVEEQHTETTLNGNFHFSLCGKFMDIEQNQLEEGIKDSLEGSWSRKVRNSEKFQVYSPDKGWLPIKFLRGSTHERIDTIRQIPICCFVTLSIENDFVCDESGVRKLKKDIVNNLTKQFGNRKIFLFHPDELFKRFEYAFSDNDWTYHHGLVSYYDEKQFNHPIPYEEFRKNPFFSIFYKREKFMFQREYRIALNHRASGDVDINVGDIRDITTVLDISRLSDLQLQEDNL